LLAAVSGFDPNLAGRTIRTDLALCGSWPASMRIQYHIHRREVSPHIPPIILVSTRKLSFRALPMNLPAALIQPLVQIALLTLGDVAAVLGLILIQAALLTAKLCVVVRGLLRIDLAIGNTTINAAFLIVDALLNLVDTRMAWVRHSALGEG
jgi:hypothetical protein